MPKQLVVNIRLKRTVEYFADLTEVALALHQMDLLTAFDWRLGYARYPDEIDWFPPDRHFLYVSHRAEIKSLSISSPMELVVTLPHAEWLIGLLLAFVIGYDKIRENIPLIQADVLDLVNQAIDDLNGATDAIKSHLKTVAAHMIRDLLEGPEQLTYDWFRRIYEVRRRLSGLAADQTSFPQIELQDADDNRSEPKE